MNVLIIPEDFRNDQYILKPLFVRLFKSFGLPRARIRICQDPLLGGVREALKMDRLSQIVDRYRHMTDIFVLCVDRDGDEGRRVRLEEIEINFQDHYLFLAENAWEEIETWALAGLNLPSKWKWKDVRSSVSVKETYFEKFAQIRGVGDGPGGGRKSLGLEAARHVSVIRSKCQEDFDRLASRLESSI